MVTCSFRNSYIPAFLAALTQQMCPFKTAVWEQVLGVGPGCERSHNTPTANNLEVKGPAPPVQTHAPQMTTSLWTKETVSACVIVCCQWRGASRDGVGRADIWVSSRQRNKCSQGDSLPHRDRRKTSTQSVTVKRKHFQNKFKGSWMCVHGAGAHV